MDRYEEAVLEYITEDPARFVSPQFCIPYENSQGGSLPDFVVIDYNASTIYVVEVTVSSNTNGIIEKVQNRESRWLLPIRAHFGQLNEDFKDWRYRVALFVRPEEEHRVRTALAFDDVSILPLKDKVIHRWKWDWVGEKANNPLE